MMRKVVLGSHHNTGAASEGHLTDSLSTRLFLGKKVLLGWNAKSEMKGPEKAIWRKKGHGAQGLFAIESPLAQCQEHGHIMQTWGGKLGLKGKEQATQGMKAVSVV
jgi:hypothetical protein